jgi:hypothetical protein
MAALNQEECISILKDVQPDLLEALPLRVVQDVVGKALEGQNADRIASQYHRSSAGAASFTFAGEVKDIAQIVVAIQTIYNVAKDFGGKPEIQEVFAKVRKILSQQINEEFIPLLEHLVECVVSRLSHPGANE